MTPYTVDPMVAGPAWAIRRVGPCVLGYWGAPMTEERVQDCARLYRAAHRAHGKFSVFAVYTTTPFHLETLLQATARDSVVKLMNEFGPHFTAVTCVFEMKSGFTASIARASAAAVTRLTSRHIPFVFADTRTQAYTVARARGALDVVDEATHERELRALQQRAEDPKRPSMPT